MGSKAREYSSTGLESKAEILSIWLNNSTDTTPLIFSVICMFNIQSFWKTTIKWDSPDNHSLPDIAPGLLLSQVKTD